MAYQSNLKGRSRLCRSISSIRILLLLSQLTVTTKNLWGRKNGTEQGLKNQQKNDNIEFRKKRMTKWKSNVKSKNI